MPTTDLKVFTPNQSDCDQNEPELNTKQSDKESLRPNLCYLHYYAFALGVGVWQTSFVVSGNSQTTPVFAAKFGWDKEQTKFFNSLISSAGIFGSMIGALIGGKAIQVGRRKAAIYWQFLAIVGSGITMICTVPTLCLGRFLCGITAGVVNNVMGKSLDETIPVKASGQFGTLLNTYICIGFPISYLLGAFLPDEPDEMAEDEMWRIIYGAPALLAIAQILLFLLVFKHEPVAYNVALRNEEDAKALLRKVYKKTDNFDALINTEYRLLMRTTSKDLSRVSFQAAVCNPKYRKATWIAVGLFSFQQFSAMNGLIPYANRLIVSIKEANDDFPLSPRNAAYIMGFMNMFGALLSYVTVTYVGRKPILMIGQSGMTLFYFVCGIGLIFGWLNTVFIALCLFIFLFQATVGPLAWVYAAEITVDSANGLSITVLFFWGTIISLTFEYMIFGPLGPHGTFLLFATICFIGFLWVWMIVKETKGLNGIRKKTLYTPINRTLSVEFEIKNPPDLKSPASIQEKEKI